MAVSVRNQVTKVFKDIKRDLTKAEVAALNRAGKTAYSRTLKFIRQDYKIKLSDLKNYFKTSKATKNRIVFTIIAKQKPIALSKFLTPAQQSRYMQKQVKSGVKVTTKRGKRNTYANAFVRKVKNDHVAVLVRKGESQYPLKELYGPDPGKLFGDKVAQAMLEKVFVERYEIEFNRAVQHVK